jgi:hypothetical protein
VKSVISSKHAVNEEQRISPTLCCCVDTAAAKNGFALDDRLPNRLLFFISDKHLAPVDETVFFQTPL